MTSIQDNGFHQKRHDIMTDVENHEEAKKFIVKYRQNYYDITTFLHKHPGGINTLKALDNSDMTGRFLKAPPHSDAAIYLMNEYKIKQAKKRKIEHKNDHVSRNGIKTVENSLMGNGIELIEEKDAGEDRNNNQLDESMEHLVDWTVAMLPQIPKITKYYDEWVHKPVDRPLRLFRPWYLEMFTKTPWWLVPLFWIPVIFKFVFDGIQSANPPLGIEMIILLTLYFLVGILFWTFLEYTLHRWVFHMKTKDTTKKWVCTFHFMIHGLHHKVPFDPMRLVFPPIPGAVIAIILYTPLSFIVPYPRILLAGALFGYLCYDMMHYYLHYGNPNLKHLYHMKRYHYQHHFAHQDQGYGISSPLWDFVFNTRIHLRQLRFKLKWL